MDGTHNGSLSKEGAELAAVRHQRELMANFHAQEAAARLMAESELASAKTKIAQLEQALAKALEAK